MRVLFLFSDPPDTSPLRLDKEDAEVFALTKRFSESVTVERQHASRVNDVHELITTGAFDVVQFSGHGNGRGLYLCAADRDAGETVAPERVVSLLNLSDPGPRLAVFLACYSDDSLQTLAKAAPFVVTSRGEVGDDDCILFVRGFYEHLFAHGIDSVQAAFAHARVALKAHGAPDETFALVRQAALISEGRQLIESSPGPYGKTILVDVSGVTDDISRLGLKPEEVFHLIATKITIHFWIFDCPRERALLPIGRLLFGEFSWTDSSVAVECRRLVRLRSDVPLAQWRIWSQLLASYNDLASARYRSPKIGRPASPENTRLLEEAVHLFSHNATRFVEPAQKVIEALKCPDALPHLVSVVTEIDRAADKFGLEQYELVVAALESALMHHHQLVDVLQPPEAE